MLTVLTVLRHRLASERGATAILLAMWMLLLIGFAAVAIDLSAGFNERRADQNAADAAVMAGVLEAAGGPVAVRDVVLDYVRDNLDTEYGDSGNPADPTWLALWEECSDPGRTAVGFDYRPVPSLSGMPGPTIDCISIDPAGFVRVRVPDQAVATTFGRVLGLDRLVTNAAAAAELDATTRGGVLPLAMLGGTGAGAELCLQSGPGNTPAPPCGPAATGLRAVDVDTYGNPRLGTTSDCGLGSGSRFARHLAVGIDHFLAPAPSASGPFVSDSCGTFAPSATLVFDELFASLNRGLVSDQTFGTGGTPSRLQNGANTKRVVRSASLAWALDNRPLWTYLVPNGVAACDPDHPNFTSPTAPEDATQQVRDCLTSAGTAALFSSDIAGSPRFAYAIEIWEKDWPIVTARRGIARLRPVWIQEVGFNCASGACDAVFDPGEGSADICVPSPVCSPLVVTQVSVFALTEGNLPESLRTRGANGTLGPWDPLLFR